jgi:hypothetical protein
METTQLNNNNEIEIRNFDLKLSEDSEFIEGIAIVFNSESEEMTTRTGQKFTEKIDKQSITQELIDTQDIIMKFNHKEDSLLARSKNGKGSLKVDVTDSGVNFSFRPKTKDRYLLEDIANGDIQGASFAFRLADKGEKWEKRGNKYLRTITKIDAIKDLSLVINPAYPATTVNTRALDELIQAEIDEKLLAEEKQKDFLIYKDNFKKEIEKYKLIL